MRPEILNPLFCSVENLKGVGSRCVALLKNLCGGTLVADILKHLPVGLTDRTYGPELIRAESGKIWTGVVKVENHIKPASKKQPYKICVRDNSAELILNFFKYYPETLKKQFPVGEVRAISGKIEWFNNALQMNHPDYVLPAGALAEIKTIEPVYPLTAGITGKMMVKFARQALLKLPELPEWLDKNLLTREKFADFKTALTMAHNPQKEADLSPFAGCRRRLAYDELLALSLVLALARCKNKKRTGIVMNGNGALRQKLLNCLGFELTGAQKRVLDEIYDDQAQNFQMLRLVQGDVGSGKTIVAFMALLNAVECGYQGTLMAPTEILAKQHLETMSVWAEALNLKIELLTGKIKGKKRAEILTDLKNGKIDILIGTHALFTEDVTFKNLAMAVVDEQHRFGVKQRLELSAKGYHPDILVMTATPIPRTLVLTQYGDMAYSKIDELPAGRQPVLTSVVPIKKINDVVEALKRKLKTGARAYWVCPLVEESEKSDLAAVMSRYENLCEIFGDKVGLVHGKMKEDEKDAVMERFKNGQINLLVATTVIEVGVNVPEATVMIIERAERFGLSQLHQLRGRIKRGNQASNCILMYGYPLSQTAVERLEVMKQSEDGFLIAEKDLDLRGGGELLGTKQSGFQEFKFADLNFHKDLLEIANADAKLIVATDPDLKSERGQALKVLLYLFEKDEAFLTYIAR